MNERIEVGDVCEIVDPSGAELRPEFVGLECKAVRWIEWEPGWLVVDIPSMPCPYGDRYWHAHHTWLRKKPPKQQDDAEPCLDHIPAEPEFIEDLQRRLSKTTEPA